MSTGVRILIFGILSICCCFLVFGPLAIIQANQALSSGDVSEADMGMVKIGKILGIIGIVLNVLWLVFAIATGGLAAMMAGAGTIIR